MSSINTKKIYTSIIKPNSYININFGLRSQRLIIFRFPSRFWNNQYNKPMAKNLYRITRMDTKLVYKQAIFRLRLLTFYLAASIFNIWKTQCIYIQRGIIFSNLYWHSVKWSAARNTMWIQRNSNFYNFKGGSNKMWIFLPLKFPLNIDRQKRKHWNKGSTSLTKGCSEW